MQCEQRRPRLWSLRRQERPAGARARPPGGHLPTSAHTCASRARVRATESVRSQSSRAALSEAQACVVPETLTYKSARPSWVRPIAQSAEAIRRTRVRPGEGFFPKALQRRGGRRRTAAAAAAGRGQLLAEGVLPSSPRSLSRQARLRAGWLRALGAATTLCGHDFVRPGNLDPVSRRVASEAEACVVPETLTYKSARASRAS